MFDPSLKLCDPGAVCGCVRHPFTEWNMREREKEDDTIEFIRNK